jgi:hypothetical protein
MPWPKRRMNRNLRAMLRSEDENNKSLAEYVPNFGSI